MHKLTSSVVGFLQFHVVQSDATLNRVGLISFACRCKAKPVSVQEADHILAVDALFSLPADMQHTTKLDVTKVADPILGCSVESLRDMSVLVCMHTMERQDQPPFAYLIGEDEAVLEDPCLFQGRFDTSTVSRPVYLCGCLTESAQHCFDLHVRVGTVANRSIL